MQTTAPLPEAPGEDADISDADRVRNARHDRGLSQPELARVLGLSRETISRIEQGRMPVPFKRRVQFMDALGIELPRRSR